MVETESESVRERMKSYLAPRICPTCHGARLNPVSLAVTVGGLSIDKFNALSIAEAADFLNQLEMDKEKTQIAGDVLREIRSRLKFLCDVGLSYLSLDRSSGTLSGGEAQRIRLATQLGSALVGVLYILDEPSIGLHQRDNDLLIDTLKKLRDLGNTVIVVEHDLDTIRSADYVMDLGPGAGRSGGAIVAEGTPEFVVLKSKGHTARFLKEKLAGA